MGSCFFISFQQSLRVMESVSEELSVSRWQQTEEMRLSNKSKTWTKLKRVLCFNTWQWYCACFWELKLLFTTEGLVHPHWAQNVSVRNFSSAQRLWRMYVIIYIVVTVDHISVVIHTVNINLFLWNYSRIPPPISSTSIPAESSFALTSIFFLWDRYTLRSPFQLYLECIC